MRPLALACALLAGSVAPSALAAGPPRMAAVEATFAKAQRLFEAGKYKEALALFRETLDASKSPNARLYIARCLELLGQIAEAYDEMSETLRTATERAESEPKYARTRDAAASELALLAARVGRVAVAVTDAPDAMDVTVNGAPVSSDRLGAPLTVMPGRVVIVARVPESGARATRELSIKGGETKIVVLSLSTDPAGGVGGVRIAGIAVTGVGLAGLATFGVFQLMAESRLDTVKGGCGGVRCVDPKYADVIDEGKTMERVSAVGLAIGAVGLLAGGAMIVLGGPSKPDGKSATSIQIGPTSLCFVAKF